MATLMSGEEVNRTIYVGNLDEAVDADTLRGIFITFGDIKNIDIPHDFQTNKPRGFAFIEFEEEEDAEHAIDNYDDAEIFGRIVRVKKARPQRMKQGVSKPIWETENWHKANVQAYENKTQAGEEGK